MEINLDNYTTCIWCNAANRNNIVDGVKILPTKCFRCGLVPTRSSDSLDSTVSNVTEKKKKTSSTTHSRGAVKRRENFNTVLTGLPVIGVDPGARYTGIIIRDVDVVLHSSTLVRPKEMDGVSWAVSVVDQLNDILIEGEWTELPIGVEGVNDPKGFHKGKRAALNPKDIIRAGIVLGAVVAVWRKAIIIPPGGNGSQHISHYPEVLVGRRPKDLPGSSNGAGTRGHEQSAYDVAGKTIKIVYPKNKKTISFND